MTSFENTRNLLKKTNIHLTGIYSAEELLELAWTAAENGTHLTISDKSYDYELLSQVAALAGKNVTFVE